MKGLNAYPLATAFCSKFAIACLTCGRRDVLGLDHDHGGRGRAGEGLVDRGLRLHHGQALRHAVVGGRQAELEVDGRERERDEDRRRGDDRDDRVPEHGAQDALPDRRLAAAAPEQALHASGTARSRRPRRRRCRGRRSGTRDPSARWPGMRAEEARRLRGEQGRQHRQRADDRGRDDQDRGQGDAREHAVAGQEHAAHRGHDREAGDEHGAARGGRGDLDRVDLAGAARAAPGARGRCRRSSSRRRRRGRSAGSPTASTSVTGSSWLATAVRPSAATTALMASATGMPAISRPPNAMIRIRSVMGSESCSAFWKSLPCVSS